MLSLNNAVFVPPSITTIDCGTSACAGTKKDVKSVTTTNNFLIKDPTPKQYKELV